jgi:hypothetical protein
MPSWGQYIESVEEITAGNFFGFGARQISMGGTGIMTNDGTSLFYNPANLARVPRIELNFGVSHQSFNDKTNIRPIRKIVDYNSVIPSVGTFNGRFSGYSPTAGRFDDSKNNSRFNSAIITVPYPTYRGSLVFGFGVARVSDFDRVFKMYHRDDSIAGQSIIALGREFQSGGLYQWGFGAGIDLSPRISVGATVSIYSGAHEYDWEYYLDSAHVFAYHKEQYIEDKYLGIGAKFGLALQMNQYLGLGLALETPSLLNVEEFATDYYYYVADSTIEDEGSSNVEYNIIRPFVISAGMMSRYSNATLMVDIDYTDWSELSYSNNVDMEQYNDQIKNYYTDALRFKIGGEYIFPILGLSMRSGLFTDPLPIKEQFQNKSRWGYSFGAGILIDQVMTIDFAYLHGSYSRNSDWAYSPVYDGTDNKYHYLTIDEDISFDRLYLTAAYRF